jgi:hypothetical protein
VTFVVPRRGRFALQVRTTVNTKGLSYVNSFVQRYFEYYTGPKQMTLEFT